MSTEQQNLEHYRVMLEPRRKLILGVICAIAFLTAGLSAQGSWKTWQLWLHGGSFGVKDPLFHRDISFFAWDYPAYRLMLGFGEIDGGYADAVAEHVLAGLAPR